MRTFVSIDRLKIFARHGVLEQEALAGNDFEVSVTLEYDFMEAAATDNVDLTINYAELTALVVDAMSMQRRLLEAVALDIYNGIMGRWPAVVSGEITITKVHPPIQPPTPRASVALKW